MPSRADPIFLYGKKNEMLLFAVCAIKIWRRGLRPSTLVERGEKPSLERNSI